MDVDHLGIALVEQLVDKGIGVKDVADLYSLTALQVGALERMGDKSAKNVVASIDVSRTNSSIASCAASAFPRSARSRPSSSPRPAARFQTEILAWSPRGACARRSTRYAASGPRWSTASPSVLRGPLPARARGPSSSLARRRHARAAALKAAVTEGPLVGKSFCVTGVLSRKREDIHAELRAAGARVDDGVKKDTTYLVAGEKTGKAKLEQAKKHGTQVITEAQMEMLLRGEALPLAGSLEKRPIAQRYMARGLAAAPEGPTAVVVPVRVPNDRRGLGTRARRAGARLRAHSQPRPVALAQILGKLGEEAPRTRRWGPSRPSSPRPRGAT